MSPNASTAVIGMGCVYPGALDPETLWEYILAGRRYFRISPDERLPNQYYFDPDPEILGKTYCDRMAVIDGWSFDPTEWRIPPITYNQSEIVHWLSLHTAAQAMQEAKIDFTKTDKRRVGVVLGNSGIGEFHRSYLLRNRWPFVERAVRRAIDKTVTIHGLKFRVIAVLDRQGSFLGMQSFDKQVILPISSLQRSPPMHRSPFSPQNA